MRFISFKTLIIVLIAGTVPSSLSSQSFEEVANIFDKYEIEDGTFLLYNLNEDVTNIYNLKLAEERISPASTFKIFNSLVALETGVIKGKDHILKWDGKQYGPTSWNRDHNLASAFSNSVVWYYREVARRIGKDASDSLLKLNRYGNMNTGDIPDKYWLDNSLQISPVEQLLFLKNLYQNNLKFSGVVMEEVKEIMIWSQNDSITIRAKSGTTVVIDGNTNGWWVGWVETGDNTYLFTTLIRSSDPDDPGIFNKRIDVTIDILTACGILPETAPQRTIGVPEVSIDEMIGQMIMVGMKGTTVDKNNATLKKALEAGKIGGVILFEKNIAKENSAENLRKISNDLQHHSKTPLFIAIDQEGGIVNRLKVKYGFPPSKTATWLGKNNSIDSTYKYAGITAQTLKSLGININFAPVIDLCSNPDNPIIAGYGRCFSADPVVVAQQAGWVIDAHHQYGVLTTVKHFPGHGSSKGDTHKGMTDVTSLWTSNELIPYANLINNHTIDAVMTAHIVNCKLDKKCNPATLSKNIITGLLRDSLGFDGVVFTDDMQMHAITKYYGLEKSINMAILAGVDVVLFSNNISGSRKHQADVVHAIIKKMVEEGVISKERIIESYNRIIKMKQSVFPFYSFPG